MYRLCEFCAFVLRSAASEQHDAASLVAWLAAFRSTLQDLGDGSSYLLVDLVPGTLQVLDGIATSTSTVMGAACTVLWETLRPPTPRSTKQLEELVAFEQVMHRFDQACRRFDQPITRLTEHRVMLAGASKAALIHGADIADLSAQLGSLLPTDGDDSSATKPGRTPHFVPVFEGLSQHAALLAMTGNSLPAEKVAAIEMLAMRAAIDSTVTTGVDSGSWTLTDYLALLPRLLPTSDRDDYHMAVSYTHLTLPTKRIV